MGGTLGPDDTLTVGGRTIRAIACPIGIDAQDFIASAGSATARDVQQRMSESGIGRGLIVGVDRLDYRSEEHTSELQSLMRISYAVFCLKKKKTRNNTSIKHHQYNN